MRTGRIQTLARPVTRVTLPTRTDLNTVFFVQFVVVRGFSTIKCVFVSFFSTFFFLYIVSRRRVTQYDMCNDYVTRYTTRFAHTHSQTHEKLNIYVDLCLKRKNIRKKSTHTRPRRNTTRNLTRSMSQHVKFYILLDFVTRHCQCLGLTGPSSECMNTNNIFFLTSKHKVKSCDQPRYAAQVLQFLIY